MPGEPSPYREVGLHGSMVTHIPERPRLKRGDWSVSPKELARIRRHEPKKIKCRRKDCKQLVSRYSDIFFCSAHIPEVYRQTMKKKTVVGRYWQRGRRR
jgi:hypothetical protein